MKLIHTLSAFDVFGPEKTVLNECAALNDAGWETEIINFWHTGDIPLAAKARARGLRYSNIVSTRKFDPAAVRALYRRLREAGRPLVHSHGYKADLYTLIAGKLAGVPLVTTVHGFTSENLKVRLYEKLEKISWRFFDRVFSVSEASRRIGRRAGVPQDKLVVVPNGIPGIYRLAAGGGARTAMRARLALAQEHVAVAIIGRLGIEKAHANFLQSAAQVLRHQPQARFVIVGEGPERPRIEALVEQLGLAPYVQLLGHRDDLPEIYPAIDVLAITSLREGFPNVLLEAMLHAIPAVATAVGGIPEVIRDGHDGVLVPAQDVAAYGDALERIVADPALRRRLGEAAREKVLREYLFEQRVRNVARLYGETYAASAPADK